MHSTTWKRKHRMSSNISKVNTTKWPSQASNAPEYEPVPGPSGMNDEPVSDSPPSEAEPVLKRPRKEVVDAIQHQYRGPTHTVLSRLRPVEVKSKTVQDSCSELEDNNKDENIIINIEKLSDLITEFSKHHCKIPKATIDVIHRQGLCVTVVCKCDNGKCKFTTPPVKVYVEMDSHDAAKTGPAKGSLNSSLLLGALKTKAGPRDLRMFLACLNIRPPTNSFLYKEFNALNDTMARINEEAMVDNQNFVRECLLLLGREPEISVETDMAYNNRLQAGYEAASASFSPLIEQETSRKLTVGMETAQKLCLKKKCDHSGSGCSRTYNPDDTISSAESKLASKNIEKVNSRNIVKVQTVLTDGGKQYPKMIKELNNKTDNNIKHELCFQHLMRNLYKKVKDVKLNIQQHDKTVFMEKLSSCIRSRVRLELSYIHASCEDRDSFVEVANRAINNIILCLSGLHMNCRDTSHVCLAHLPKFNFKHLPFGQYLQLSREDELKLTTVLTNSLSIHTLMKIPRLLTSNKCESMNHRAFTYAPKSVLWGRNFNGLCHSAVHSDTKGTGLSTMLVVKYIGVKYAKRSPFMREMIRRDLLDKYRAKQKQTKQYKYKRHISRLKKANRKVRQNSFYNDCTSQQREMHNYGIDPNKH